MGSQVQFNGTRSVLSHCPDALDAGDEGLDLVWALYGVEAQSTNCEGSIGASTVAGVVSERDGTHRVARRRKCLNGYITGGKDLAVTDHEVGLDHCPRTRASSQLRRRFGGFTPALTRHGKARLGLQQRLQSRRAAGVVKVAMRDNDELDVLWVETERSDVVEQL